MDFDGAAQPDGPRRLDPRDARRGAGGGRPEALLRERLSGADGLRVARARRPARLSAPEGRDAAAGLARARLRAVRRVAEPPARASARASGPATRPSRRRAASRSGPPTPTAPPRTRSARFAIDVRVNAAPTPNDVLIDVGTTDVRCSGRGITTCGSANAAAGPDYAGQLQETTALRITDTRLLAERLGHHAGRPVPGHGAVHGERQHRRRLDLRGLDERQLGRAGRR